MVLHGIDTLGVRTYCLAGSNVLITDLFETSFPDVYEALASLFPEKPWLKRIADLNTHTRASPVSSQLNRKANRIAYGLSEFDSLGMGLLNDPRWEDVKAAMGCAAQVIALANDLDKAAAKSFLKRVRGAFSNPDDMRALQCELHTAICLFRKGLSLEWPDECSGPETFDILASGSLILPFEVECKSWSPDKGRPITSQEASQLFDRLIPALMALWQPAEILSLVISVPNRVPKAPEEIGRFVQLVIEAVRENRPSIEGVAEIIAHRLPVPYLASIHDPHLLQQAIYCDVVQAHGEIRGYMGVSFGHGSALTVEVRSERAAQIFKKMWADAKHAIRNQMTGKRPGCLVVRLEGLTKEELERFGTEANNPLEVFAYRVFSHKEHEHLACLVFTSDSEKVAVGPSAETGQSATYYFDRTQGKYANLGIGRRLFESIY